MELPARCLVCLSWLGCLTESLIEAGLPPGYLTDLFAALAEDDDWQKKRQPVNPSEVVWLGPSLSVWLRSVLTQCEPDSDDPIKWRIERKRAIEVTMRSIHTYYQGAEKTLREHGVEVSRKSDEKADWLANELKNGMSNWPIRSDR